MSTYSLIQYELAGDQGTEITVLVTEDTAHNCAVATYTRIVKCESQSFRISIGYDEETVISAMYDGGSKEGDILTLCAVLDESTGHRFLSFPQHCDDTDLTVVYSETFAVTHVLRK